MWGTFVSKIIKEIQFGEHQLVLETGEIARQADASVMISMNGTSVLVTVVFKKEGGAKNSFFPLTVNYQERFYASGNIPGGFLKREGRPTDGEILVCRLIDRPVRPLFPEGFRNDVQVVATVMSLNPEVSPDILALIGASAALKLSGVPFAGPIAAARVGYKDGIYSLNPSPADLKDSELDLVVACTSKAILMVESEAKELPEEVMLGAVLYGHEMMQSVITAINELVDENGTVPFEWEAPQEIAGVVDAVLAQANGPLSDAYLLRDKAERYKALSIARKEVIAALVTDICRIMTERL
jgi:polyribonucleotide nucleotidyltransferase